jgi:serine/threonine-protein kinase ATR
LFHWEQYIRKCNSQVEVNEQSNPEALYQRLQNIYSQIDEPDGIEGISSHLSALDIDQQVLEHRKAGRWATAQSWYELQLEKDSANVEAQWNLVTCLKESGQQGNYAPSNLYCIESYQLTLCRRDSHSF